MWLSTTLAKVGAGAYTGVLIRTSGPGFNAALFSPDAVSRTVVGTATLTFTNGNAGSFFYQVSDGIKVVTQTKAITRQVFRSPGTVCH